MKKGRKRQFLAFLLALVMVIGQMAGTPGLTIHAEEGTGEEGIGDVVEEECDYYFPVGDDISQLPDWDYGISKYLNYNIRNAQNPDGIEGQTEITGIRVENGEEETSTDPVVTINEWDDGSGWNLHMNRMGHAVGTITYKLADESGTATHIFNIWVGDSVYSVDAATDTGVWQLLPNDSFVVTPTVRLDCYNEEEGHFSGSTEDVSLEWTYGANDESYAEAFEVSENEGILNVTAKENSAERSLQIELRAYVPNESSETGRDEVAYGEWWIESCNCYQMMEITSEVGTMLEIGKTTKVDADLWDYCVDYKDSESRRKEITGGYQYRWEWDAQAIQITDAKGKVLSKDDSTGKAPFTVTKLKNWGTSADLIFELRNDDGAFNEVQRKSWYFEELNYEVWFEDLRGEGFSCMYVSADNSTGEAYSISLNTENLQDKAEGSYTLEWIVGIWDETEEKTIPLILEETQDIYTIEDQYERITLQAAKLKKALVDQFGGKYGLSMENNLWANVEVKVYLGEGESRQEVAGCGTGIEIRQEVYDYQFPIEDGMGMLPNWSCDINKFFNGYVENPDNPEGGNVSVEITEISVANAKDEETKEEVVICTPWEDGNGWNITANTYGHAVATITYTLADGSGTTTESFSDIWVSDCIYNVDVSSDTNELVLVPGEALNLTPRAWADCYDEENGQWSENLENATLEWKYGENDSDYAEAFEVEEKDGKLFVKALDNSIGRDLMVQLSASIPDENGNLCEVAYGEWWINSTEFYYTIKTDEVVCELAVGETCQIAPSLELHNLEGGTINVEEITENLQYCVEWDINSVKVTDDENKTLENGRDTGTAPFTMQKLNNYGTDVSIIAERADQEGNYSEVTRRSWWLNGQNYDISFNNLREEGNTWIFAAEDTASDVAYAASEEDEEYTLELNTENLTNKCADGYEIKWSVEVYVQAEDAEEWYSKEVTADNGEYKVSENGASITFYAGKLKDTLQSVLGRAEDDNEYMNVTVHAAVLVGVGDNKEECAGCFTNLDILLPEYSIKEHSIGDTLLQDVLSYEDGKMDAYIKNKDYPYGKAFTFDITGIETSNMEGWEESPEVFSAVYKEDSKEWTVTATNYGGGYITYHTRNESIGDKDFTVEIWVKSDVYRIYPYMDTGSSHLLPGASAQICYDIEHGHYDEAAQEAKWETVEQSDKYRVSFKDYDLDLITVDEKGKITANTDEKYWGTDVRVVLEVDMGDGWSEERSEGVGVDVTECYYQIFAEEVIGEPGEKVNIPVVFKKFDLEHRDGIEIKGVQYQITSDTPLLTADETGTSVTISKDAATVKDELFGKLVVVAADYTDEWNNAVHEETTTAIRICAHNYKETNRKDPSCTLAGSVSYKCSKCGTEKTETLTASGHLMTTIEAKDATCTTEGNNKYYQCKTCKKYFKDAAGTKATTVAAETIKAKGHNYELDVTKATLNKDGSSVMKCSCGTEKKETKTVIAYPKTIKLSATTYTYTGKNQKKAPTLIVKDSKGKKISSKNYTVTGLKKYKKVGTYTVTVEFKGNYSGTKKLTFSIVPKTTSISEVTAAKKGFTVKWKKQTRQTNGYQIQYATKKNFKKAKTVTVSKNKTTSQKITKLTAKKEYYVRIRTYKTVKVKGKSTKLYSGWSDYVTVTTKK